MAVKISLTVGPVGANVIKLFLSIIFVISQSVRTRQAFQAYSIKHSSLVRKLVTYGRKKFYNNGPRAAGRSFPTE